MTAFYNEVDPFAAAWLRELIKAGHIAPGVVDERPIQEVKPADVEGFTQAHFFAGIGVWSYALRNAGWPDDRPVWTGSCPCQPFSTSGRRRGISDERHLWPVWFQLIRECRPDVVLGEQVSSADGLAWLDVVSADVEAISYAIGALSTVAAGTGAPHGRQRLYFVADSGRQRFDRQRLRILGRGPHEDRPEASGRGETRALAYTEVAGSERCAVAGAARGQEEAGTGEGHQSTGRIKSSGDGASGILAHGHGQGLEVIRVEPSRCECPTTERGSSAGLLGHTGGEGGGRDGGTIPCPEGEGEGEGFKSRRVPDELIPSGVTRGAWADAEWWYCTDGKARAAQPGSFPLATGAPARVGRLRGTGNALCAPQAQAFIEAFLDVEAERPAVSQ